jgi:Acetyltransferase (GNAT) domain
MKTVLEFLLPPEQKFWNEYAVLWENSQYQSSFQAPLFLQFLQSRINNSLFEFKGLRNGELIAANFFYKRGSEYHFLSDMKTDHNYFMFSKDVTRDEMKQYFISLLLEIKKRKWTVRLNNQPSWAIYMDVFREALAETGVYSKIVNYNPCLVLEAETPEGLYHLTDKQKLRQKLNRLKEKDEVIFESFRESEDLDRWLDEFYEVHIRRWADTATLSSYLKIESRQFYKSCILAWIEQGILVRFSLKLGTKRIAFITALLENGYLVHHTTSFDRDYEKQSPGLIIINQVARWMADNNMKKMEYGDGGEAYKYNFSSSESPLYTIFITGNYNFPYILKANLINFVRENKGIRKFYSNSIRPLILHSKNIKKRIT